MATNSLTTRQLRSMTFEQGLDHMAPQILLKGFGRPWQLYAAHAAVFATNYCGFLLFASRDLLRLLRMHRSSSTDENPEEKARARRSLGSLIYAKFLVWQHLAEAIGCRQGPIGGHFGLPNNWKYRLSLGTMKHAALPILGKKRNMFDLFVHTLFFILGAAFLGAKEYKLKFIRALLACDVWIFLSDMSQFYASTGHAYMSMLLSACFKEGQGRLAGMQAGLIIQWFFSGIGKVGPWFGHVNGPFMLQSKFLAGQRWLFNLLIKSPTDLSPTTFGKVLGHSAAAVEYLAPLALLAPWKLWRRPAPRPTTNGAGDAKEPEQALVAKNDGQVTTWAGLAGMVGMHVYILTMPAPFDVYSWNACFGLSAIYLFYYGSFGFDHESARNMHPALVAFLAGEVALCWYGQFFPDQVGYYLSHRYWAGNWVQTFFYVKNTAVAKLGRVKTCSAEPMVWQSLQRLSGTTGIANMSYLWLANLNMKAVVGLLHKAVRLAGGPEAQFHDYFPIGLAQFCCGEFRDALYALPLLPTMQEQIGFDEGECFMLRLGAFGMLRDSATWGIYDLKRGLLEGGVQKMSDLAKVSAFPSQSLAALSSA